MSSGERPIGAAKGKQIDTEALRQPPALLTRECQNTVTPRCHVFESFLEPPFLQFQSKRNAVCSFVQAARRVTMGGKVAVRL